MLVSEFVLAVSYHFFALLSDYMLVGNGSTVYGKGIFLSLSILPGGTIYLDVELSIIK